MLVYLPTENGLKAVSPRYIVLMERAMKLGEGPDPNKCFVVVQAGSNVKQYLVNQTLGETADAVERAMHGLPPIDETSEEE